MDQGTKGPVLARSGQSTQSHTTSTKLSEDNSFRGPQLLDTRA